MDTAALEQFLKERKESPHAKDYDEPLPCIGCAHSASGEPFPGRPSGERPCCSCVRNDEREEWAAESLVTEHLEIVTDDLGDARLFNPFWGSMYNGAPRLYFPMDNYVTLDQRDQEEWLRKHPEYARPIRFVDNMPVVIFDES